MKFVWFQFLSIVLSCQNERKQNLEKLIMLIANSSKKNFKNKENFKLMQ